VSDLAVNAVRLVTTGGAPAKIGWAILVFFLIGTTHFIVKDVVAPVLKALGKGLAGRLEARLMPPRQDEGNP
jgi:hypothetical protein